MFSVIKYSTKTLDTSSNVVFVLHLDDVELKYTPKLADFLNNFVHVKISVCQGMVNPCDVQISGHIDFEFC